ncbi:MAG TPA: hypothetical protein VL240_03935 [Candidatus Binatia bacterium]|nr:hypothetical protein [Candidatus Binatia bacterium]
MKPLALLALLLCALPGAGQEVHVSSGKNSVTLAVSAKQPYALVGIETKVPTLGVQCSHKGNRSQHLLMFSPGGALVEDTSPDNPKNEQLGLTMTIAGKKQATTWIPYGDVITFAWYGKTEPERVQFIESLLASSSPTVSITFTPFLTGVPTTSVFDLTELREEIGKHAECSMK